MSNGNSSITGPQGVATFSSTPFYLNVLLSDGDDVVSRSATLGSGIGLIARGTIVHYNPSTKAVTASDGTLGGANEPNAIMVNDTDSTSGAQPCDVYISGKFRADAITWGAGTPAVIADILRNHHILIETVIQTVGQITSPLMVATPDDASAQQAPTDPTQQQTQQPYSYPPGYPPPQQP
jgi:hypothetical protein